MTSSETAGAKPGCKLPEEGVDYFAATKNISVIPFPGGQGLKIKP
jgi:hypothetical protein